MSTNTQNASNPQTPQRPSDSISSDPIQVFYETTPNPNSMKFYTTFPIATETANFSQANQSKRSPLASKIFGFPWAKEVFIGSNFVTITKQDWVGWDLLADPLSRLIEEHLELGEPVLLMPEVETAVSATLNASRQDMSPTVEKILALIDEEIRPAVAMDGGDVRFVKYENQIVYLEMMGSCSGCPSSTMTLKMGIETRMREAVPEILEVVAI